MDSTDETDWLRSRGDEHTTRKQVLDNQQNTRLQVYSMQSEQLPMGFGSETPPLIKHLERFLGTIQHGWSKFPDRLDLGFQIVECNGGTLKGISTFATIGLSEYELPSAVSDKRIRHELILPAPTRFGARNIPALLRQIGVEAITRNSAYLRGEVLGPRGQLFQGKPFEAIFVTLPMCLPDEFANSANKAGECVVIAWLVPITRSEALYVREYGWGAFELLLEQNDVDLFDFERTSVC